MDDEDIELRNKILQQLLKSMGKDVWVEPDFRCEYGKNITIEDNVYINFGCIILDCAEISIGSHTLLGPISDFMQQIILRMRMKE